VRARLEQEVRLLDALTPTSSKSWQSAVGLRAPRRRVVVFRVGPKAGPRQPTSH